MADVFTGEPGIEVGLLACDECESAAAQPVEQADSRANSSPDHIELAVGGDRPTTVGETISAAEADDPKWVKDFEHCSPGLAQTSVGLTRSPQERVPRRRSRRWLTSTRAAGSRTRY